MISEFLASNKHVLADEDGDYSDWIEIHNPDPASVDMNGWYLTDSASNLKKWQFPAVTIPAGGYLVVFASSKNRRVPGQQLHTNFALSAGGEYLGLIAPDGVTKVSEFAPEFPEQYEDVSYGVSSSLQTVVVTQPGSTMKILVPTSNSLGTTWRDRTFDDSGWTSGAQPVGFFNYSKTSNPDLSDTLGTNLYSQMAGTRPGVYLRVPMTISDPASVRKITLKIKYDDGFAAFVNGAFGASSYSPLASSLTYNSLATGVHYPYTFEAFDLSDRISDLASGANVVAIHGMNESLSSSDAYVAAELDVVMDTGIAPVTGYFSMATPGAENGGPESVMLPQTIAYSRPAGPFTTSFSLTITGADSGQEIRYVIADPSSSPGAAISEPTSSSTLYTGPITISSSKLIRAAVFDATTGQKGKTLTTQYLLLETGTSNNTSNFTSTLPIIVGDDHGAGEPVDSGTGTYSTSMFYLFEPVGGTASLNSTPTLSTRAGLRVRGKSSQSFPKKSYGMETWDESDNDLKMPLLGLSKESDWILNGPWNYDDTYIHNAYTYEISRQIGHWAPRTRFVEMFTNSNGGKLDYQDYAGLYVLTEKIESGSGRLDITGIEPSDNVGDALTGGYIFKVDLADSDEVSWRTSQNWPSEDNLVIVEPDADDDTEEQIDYLKGYIQSFANALVADAAGNFATRNYLKYIDRDSWIDYHIVDSLVYNVDGLRLSTFYNKDRNAKIHAGPLWDFDRALGSDDGRDSNPRSWSNIEYFFTRDWWGYLFDDPDFVQAWVDRWWELRGGVLSNTNLNALADSLGAQIGNTVGARDAAKWPNNAASGGVYLNEITAMKTWLTSTTSGSLGRAPWLDTQVPTPPTASLASAVVASGATVTLAGSGSIRYRTDGGDPRPSGGAITSSSTLYSSPLTINQTTVLIARRTGTFSPFPSAASISWSAPLLRVYLVNESFAASGDVVVSEIHFHPREPSAAEKAAVLEVTASDFEFLELKNVSDHAVNTFEMQFVEGMPFRTLKLAPHTLAPGGTALVVKNREAFEARFGTSMSSQIVGEWKEGSLSNDGEQIQILARDGSPLQTLTYEEDAPDGASWNLVGGTWLADAPSPGTDGPTFAQWTDYHFPSGGSVSEPGSDPDADLADNEREYARGTNPQTVDPLAGFGPVFTLTSDQDGMHYRFTYRRPLNRPGAHYQVEKTTDFVNWQPVSDSPVSTANGIETRQATGPAGEPPTLFLRVRADVDP